MTKPHLKIFKITKTRNFELTYIIYFLIDLFIANINKNLIIFVQKTRILFYTKKNSGLAKFP